MRCAGRLQGTGGSADSCPRRIDIVDQQGGPALQHGALVPGHREGTRHIGGTFGTAEPDLAARRLSAHQYVLPERHAGQGRHLGGQLGCLVEPSLQKPQAMQRHRNDCLLYTSPSPRD